MASGCICESNELIGARPRVVIGSFCLLLLSEEAGRCSGWTILMSDANIPQQHQQHHHQDQGQHQQESGVLDGHQSHTLGNERSLLISSKAQPSRRQRNAKEDTLNAGQSRYHFHTTLELKVDTSTNPIKYTPDACLAG